MILNTERMIKEDMAEYILEELSKYGCVPADKRTTAINAITKALIDIRRCRVKEQLKKPDS